MTVYSWAQQHCVYILYIYAGFAFLSDADMTRRLWLSDSPPVSPLVDWFSFTHLDF